MVVEDADRLTEGAANVLLKAVEEPAARTVWLLCVPSAEDLVVTIRSRCRVVALRTPPIDAVAATLRTALSSALGEESVPHSVQWAGSLFSTMFGPGAAQDGVRDYAAVQATESWRYAPFHRSLLEQGVYAPPSPFEAWFVSAAHDDAAVDRVLAALPAAAHAAAHASAPTA
jgi:hypothetical protein